MTCEGCGDFYIGSTIRALHSRVKEHLAGGNSAVGEHLRQCHGAGFRTRILARDNDPKDLRIKEGILIADLKPSLNRREEESAVLSLIQYVT